MERIPVRPAGLGAAAALAVVALTVFILRAAGVPLRGVSAGETVVYSTLFAATALVVLRWALDGIDPVRTRQGISATVTLLLSLILAAGFSSDSLTMLVCLLATVTLIGIDLFTGIAAQTANAAHSAFGEEGSAAGSHSNAGSETIEGEVPADDALRLVRSVVDGVEHLDGQIRFETAAGETAKTLHVPLWPPLPFAPKIVCELEGVDGRVRVPFSKPHGFRIEIRLPEAVDEPLSGTVRFTADCPVPAKVA